MKKTHSLIKSTTIVKRTKLKLKLTDLNADDKIKLMNMIMSQAEIFKVASMRETVKTIAHLDRIYKVDHVIKYLHFATRFRVEEQLRNFIIEEFSKKSTRFIFNSDIVRIFVEIAIDTARNKIWKEKVRAFRIVFEKNCYLMILDKKKISDHDYIEDLNKIIVTQLSYHLTDKFESRIVEQHVWFNQKFVTKKERD
jgi:hypothetical protein